jgi:hypothetical protein
MTVTMNLGILLLARVLCPQILHLGSPTLKRRSSVII